jgi:TRAP transporter TAXI family solute receptor
MRVSLALALLLAPGLLSAVSLHAQTAQKSWPPPSDKGFIREAERQKVNENVVMLLAGQVGQPYLQLAQDIAVAIDDGDRLRILPVASGGAVQNVRDILLLRGADLGISTVQALNDLKASGDFGPQLERQIAYVGVLSVDAFHVIARPGVKSLQDLKGRTVGFDTKGSGTQRFGPIVLKRLGIDVKEAHMPQADAIEAMRKGEIDATVCSCAPPVSAYPAVNSEWGFKLLEVPYVPALEQDYVPATLTSANYPNLLAPEERVQTIATSTVLITFNWGPGSDRYRKIESFVNALFANVDRLRQPPRHPAWKEFNIAASIGGWQRFPAAQEWLDRQAAEAELKAKAAGAIDVTQARSQAAKAAPNNADEQERLFKEFLEWSRSRSKR